MQVQQVHNFFDLDENCGLTLMDKQCDESGNSFDMDNSQGQEPRISSFSHPTKPVLSTEKLFGNAREVVIVHKGDEYRLCITRNDKLILTK